ncbi:MAG: hypothetical protein ACYC7D_08760 [Nitrososphaerales archaeon]
MKQITKRSRVGVTTTAFAATTIVLVIIAAAGFGLYATSTGSSKTVTSTLTGAATTVTNSGSTATSTITTTMSGSSASVISGGLLNARLQTFGYYQNYTCSPSLSSFGFNSTETTNAAKFTGCDVGAGNSTSVANSAPLFVLVPAYAGLSVFGVPALGATSEGYPVFNGSAIFTQCGAGGSASSCPDHPTYLYSPVFTLVEKHLGISSGVFTLPEGVLPTPAHTHVVGFQSGNIPWYIVAVLVFDPNVFPNAATGQCTQAVASNLTSPTGNCLNSLSAIQAAMGTSTTATANANMTQNNPIYDTLGGVSTQVVIPGVTSVSESSPANTNLFLYFSVSNSTNPYS